jgi:hypothetical protein
MLGNAVKEEHCWPSASVAEKDCSVLNFDLLAGPLFERRDSD